MVFFWIVEEEIYLNKNYCFTIPCNKDGVVLESKISDYYHNKVWLTLPEELTKNMPYNYFPRGRVEINSNKAIIYLSPNINTKPIQEFIKDQFNLRELEEIHFIANKSKHYRPYRIKYRQPSLQN